MAEAWARLMAVVDVGTLALIIVVPVAICLIGTGLVAIISDNVRYRRRGRDEARLRDMRPK